MKTTPEIGDWERLTLVEWPKMALALALRRVPFIATSSAKTTVLGGKQMSTLTAAHRPTQIFVRGE
jgi:hypothetical protein